MSKKYIESNVEVLIREFLRGVEDESKWISENYTTSNNIFTLLFRDMEEFRPHQNKSYRARGRVEMARALYDLLMKIKAESELKTR